MKKLLLMAIAATTMLACNKSDEQLFTTEDQLSTDGQKSVTLSLMSKSTVSSKAVGEEQLSTDLPTISSVKLHFLDDSGTSVFLRELTSDEVSSITSADDNSIVITGVPATAKTLFVEANTSGTDSSTSTFPTTETNSDGVSVLRIDALQGDVSTTPLSGSSEEFTTTADGSSDYTATVVVSPLVSRIEIGEVSYSNTDTDTSTEITSFQLTGVFINNIYPYVILNGATTSGDIVDIADQDDWDSDDDADWSVYLEDNLVFPYYTDDDSLPTDWADNSFVDYFTQTSDPDLTFYPNLTTGAALEASSEYDYVWAYQVVPVSTSTSLPHIILKLEDVAYNGSTVSTSTRYVTVTKYKDSSSNSITSFARGNVYKIENLEFSHDQASSKPYVDDISVTATLSVSPWTVNTITPDWN